MILMLSKYRINCHRFNWAYASTWWAIKYIRTLIYSDHKNATTLTENIYILFTH